MKKLLVLFSVLPFLLLLCTAASAETAAVVADIAKYGNLILDVTGADLFAGGYAYGDLLSVTLAGQTWEMPLCSSYSDVDTGLPVMRAESEEEAVKIAINMGDFAAASGVAAKTMIAEDPGYRWDILTSQPVQVIITLSQKGGYRAQWLSRQLAYTNAREDYAHLDDESFANFRAVDTTGMGAGRLYRSSSPINPEIGRSAYADEAARAAGIAAVLNLADAANTFESSPDAYYPACHVAYLNLDMDFAAPAFKSGLAEGLRFIIGNEGPYLIHCREGKDRTGFAAALLECLMGAPVGEVIADYMETYVNYYGVEPGSEKYDAIAGSNIVRTLAAAFQADDLYTADLAAEAEALLIEELGLTSREADSLKDRLRE